MKKYAAFFLVLSVLFFVFGTTVSAQTTSWPSSPPAQICTTQDWLKGPTIMPTGAVDVPAGDNSSFSFTFRQANTTFWFEPGVHTFGTSQFGQIIAGSNSKYIGAPGAILDGQKLNKYAFTQTASGVEIAYLEVRNFVPSDPEVAINQDSGDSWNIHHIYAHNNGGGAVGIGPNGILKYSCLKDNAVYGFQGRGPHSGTGGKNIVLDHNEIAHNDADDIEHTSRSCGCSGGGKFWDVDGALVTNNYIHDNLSAGLWADTNNNNFTVTGNWLENNYSEAFFYEISYNAVFKNNVLKHNTWGKGGEFAARGDSFPIGTIYLSEAGGDSRVTASMSNIEVANNYFEDNWGGVVGYENPNRYCSSTANTSTGYCTLVNPTVATLTTCTLPGLANAPLIDDCRWKTKNVTIHDNEFHLTPANITGCSNAYYCSRQALISESGTYPPYDNNNTKDNITFNQNNHWSNNKYFGPWRFSPWDRSNNFDFIKWQATPYNQDTGSSFNGSATSPTSTPAPTGTTNSGPTPTNVPPTSTPTPVCSLKSQGDADCNGVVDILDYGIWSQEYSKVAVTTNADFSGDGQVSLLDFEIWRHTYSNPIVTTAPTQQPTFTPKPASVNLLDSDSATFEGGVGKWQPWTDSTIAQTTAAAHSGTASLQVNPTTRFAGIQTNNWPGYTVQNTGPLTMSFWGKLGSGSNITATMQVEWRDSTNTVVQTDNVTSSPLTSTWSQTSLQIPSIPSTATHGWVTFIGITGSTGASIYLDDLYLGN